MRYPNSNNWDIRDSRVLRVMEEVPREAFVLKEDAARAAGDHPLGIGHGQTISQPYIVAYMTEALDPEQGLRVLEIGTGSGFQSAVLAAFGVELYTIERIPQLARKARTALQTLGYANIHYRQGDGRAGWPEAAPFDRIMVTAAPATLPRTLVQQLAPGGRMLIPLGPVEGAQMLVLISKDSAGRIERRNLLPVRFVPLY